MVTSMPQSSWSSSIAHRDDTASTMRRAGWPARSMAARRPGMSLATPVDVSLWVTRTALIW